MGSVLCGAVLLLLQLYIRQSRSNSWSDANSTSHAAHSKKFVFPADQLQTIPRLDRPLLPLALEFHHTRYYGGCFTRSVWEHSKYSTIQPWVYNFDYLVTGCGVNWQDPGNSETYATCTFTWANLAKPARLYEADTRPFRLKRNESTLLVHVHSDPRHMRHFVTNVLPHLEKHVSWLTVHLHSGGGDNGPQPVETKDSSQPILSSKIIKRWVTEQDRWDGYLQESKVQFLPTGICEREFDEENGPVLMFAMNHTQESHDRRRRSLMAMAADKAAAEKHRQLKEAMAKSKPWFHRKERVLFCYGDQGRPTRIEWSEHARRSRDEGGCTVCDFCQHRNNSLTHADLWRLYGEYKFVASPWGNGADCGRTWEILLLGAVPVIEYFPGATGYVNGLGEKAVVLVRNATEINAANLTAWSAVRTSGADRWKLSHEYWSRRMLE